MDKRDKLEGRKITKKQALRGLGDPATWPTHAAKVKAEFTKKPEPENEYLFSLGDSSNGAIGFCATMRGTTSKQALKRLKKAIEWFNRESDVAKATGVRGEEPDLIDLEVYFNTDYITEEDIIEVTPAKVDP